MNNPADLDLLRLFDALRPRDWQVTLIAPDGTLTHSPKFATKPEAQRWSKANAKLNSDVVVTGFAASHENN